MKNAITPSVPCDFAIERARQAAEARRQQTPEAGGDEEAVEAQTLRPAGGNERLAKLVGVREKSEEDIAVEPVVGFRTHLARNRRVFHRDAEGFNQFSVLHAGGAGRFAGAAVEAEFQVAAHFAAQFEAPFPNGYISDPSEVPG